MEPPCNKAGVSNYQTKSKQNSIKPNQTPIIWLDSVIKPSRTSILLWVWFIKPIEPIEKNRTQSDSILWDFIIESRYIKVPLYKHRNLQYMYRYLEYKSTATIGQWWNVSNHSGNIQINTVTNKGNNSSLLCDYITQCNYHSSYFSQSLNCSRGHYFTAGDSFWELCDYSVSHKTISLSLSLAFAKK